MTNIESTNKNNAKVSNASTVANPTMEGRASTLKQTREKKKEESAADKKRKNAK
jgi:hypothetical protein